MPILDLLEKPASEYTDKERKQILNDHKHLHGFYAQDIKDGKGATYMDRLYKLHERVIRKLLDLGMKPKIKDGLDETLPSDVKKRLDATEEKPLAKGRKALDPNQDVTKLEDEELRDLHYALHEAYRKHSSKGEAWGNLSTSVEDWVSYHKRIQNEIQKRGMTHGRLDAMDDMTAELTGGQKSFVREKSEEEKESTAYPIIVRWMQEASVLTKELEGKSVLELGCGVGNLLRILQASEYEAEGVEENPIYSEECSKQGLTVEAGDMLDKLMESNAGEYDNVISIHALEHTQYYKAVLVESKRIAKEASIHVVPLGLDRCKEHAREWRDIHDLRADIAVVGGYVAIEISDEAAMLMWKAGQMETTVHLEELPSFVLIPEYLSLIGSSVRGKFSADRDVLVRDEEVPKDVELQLRNALRETKQGRMQLHLLANPSGPHSDYIPLYDLVCVRRRPLEVTRVTYEEEQKAARKPLTPLGFIAPIKPAKAFDTPAEVWDEWGKKHIGEGIYIEWKADGIRALIKKDGDKVKIQSNNPDEEYSKNFPKGVSEFKQKLPKSVILDAEILKYKDGDPISREEITTLVTKGPPYNDAGVVFHVFDVLYLNGEWLLDKTYEERREELKNLRLGRLRHIQVMPTTKVTNERAFIAKAKIAAKQRGSEGTMYKVSTFPYDMGGNTQLMAKHKVVYDVLVEVMSKKMNAAGTYTYGVAVSDGKDGLIPCANTMATGISAKKGDILELRVLKAYKKDEGYSFMLPRVIEKRTDTTKPHSYKRVEQVMSLTERRSKAKLKTFKQAMTESLIENLKAADERRAAAKETAGKIKEDDTGKWVLQCHDIRSLHLDLRLEIKGKDAFAGFQLYIPSKLRKETDFPQTTLSKTGAAVIKHLKAGKTLTGSYKTVIGPKAWLDIGKRGMATFKEGTPGASPNKAGHMMAIDYGTYKAGPVLEGHHSMYFKLSGMHIKGRWLLVVGIEKKELPGGGELAAGEGRVWFFRLLAEGKGPDSEEEEAGKKATRDDESEQG